MVYFSMVYDDTANFPQAVSGFGKLCQRLLLALTGKYLLTFLQSQRY